MTTVPVVRCFMPQAEAQVAFGAPGLVPQRAVRVLAEELELLVGQLGGADDIVLTRKPVSEAHLLSLAATGLIAPRTSLAVVDHHVLPRNHPIRALGQIRAQPWAWTPDTCALLAPLKRAGAHIPSWRPARARLWSKAWAAEVLSELVHSDVVSTALLEVPVLIARDDQLQPAMGALYKQGVTVAVLKAPFASSGRGAIRVQCPVHRWTVSERGWIRRQLRTGEPLTLSPWRLRAADISVQLNTDAAQPVVGLTSLQCDDFGRYIGNPLPAPTLRDADKDALYRVGRRVAALLRERGHVGLAGIDAMLFVDRDGRVQLQPLLEINPRMTMGHVALGLRPRVVGDVPAILRVLGPRDLAGMTPAAAVARLQARWPLVQKSGLIARGCVALNDPSAATSHVALLLVGEAASLAVVDG